MCSTRFDDAVGDGPNFEPERSRGLQICGLELSRLVYPQVGGFLACKAFEDCRHKRAAQELFYCRQELVGRAINLNSEPFQRL